MPARVMGRCKGSVTSVRVLNICDVSVLPARALSRVVGVTPTPAQLWCEGGGRRYRSVTDTERMGGVSGEGVTPQEA